MIDIAAGSEVADFCYGWRYHDASFRLVVPCWLCLNKFLLRWWHVACWSLNKCRFWSVSRDLSSRFTHAVGLCWSLGWSGVWLDEEEPDFIVVDQDDRVVVDEVPIGGRVGPSIKFFVASFSDGRLKRGHWVLESGAQDRRCAPLFLLLSRVLKIVVVHRSSYSDCRRAPLQMMTFWIGIACPSRTYHHRSTMPWIYKDESQHFSPTWRTSVDVWSSYIWSRIGGNISRRDQSHVNTRHEVLDRSVSSCGVIALRPVLIYYAVEIGSPLFLLGSFGDFLRIFRISLMWIYPLYL
jgi:hypothetical protein